MRMWGERVREERRKSERGEEKEWERVTEKKSRSERERMREWRRKNKTVKEKKWGTEGERFRV